MHTRFRIAWRLVLLLLPALTLSSCASDKRGDVRGKVSYQGRPVIYGSVVLTGSDNLPVSGRINADGTYAVSGVPAGAVRVAVISPDPGKPAPPDDRQSSAARFKAATKGKGRTSKPPAVAPEVDRRKWFKLPQQYDLADTSGISTTIQPGDNTYDIDLK